MILGIGNISDTTVLQRGQQVDFGVYSYNCLGAGPDEVRTTLNNWASSYIRISYIDPSALDPLPGYVSMKVKATVMKPVEAGILRSQIKASLKALADSINSGIAATCRGGLELENDVLLVSSTGSQENVPNENPDEKDSDGIPWSTTLVVVSVAALGAVFLMKR